MQYVFCAYDQQKDNQPEFIFIKKCTFIVKYRSERKKWYGVIWYGMVNALVASQRPSIKTTIALPLQLLPEKPRNLEGEMKKNAPFALSILPLFSCLYPIPDE